MSSSVAATALIVVGILLVVLGLLVAAEFSLVVLGVVCLFGAGVIEVLARRNAA